MLLREIGSTCDDVTGNFTAEVVFERAFIRAFKFLKKAYAKGIQNLAVSAGNNKIINVCTQEDLVSVNDYSPHALFETNGFAAFSLQKSAHRRVPCAGS